MDHDKKIDDTTAQSREARVAALAHSIWEKEGYPEGRYDDHWYMACTIIDAQDAGTEAAELPTWLNRAEPKPETAEVNTEAKSTVSELPLRHRHKSAA